ncbi:Uncharacterized protein APZ42_021759 [Daphnia magna]|uniref:Uncharacterized protein n=1 Tax=Daphnia magna TaxID=35525 RepID=A0A164WHH6_9CRUS|nr:Uncharacterized protein APZ42_021759 [Daphnia magna]
MVLHIPNDIQQLKKRSVERGLDNGENLWRRMLFVVLDFLTLFVKTHSKSPQIS